MGVGKPVKLKRIKIDRENVSLYADVENNCPNNGNCGNCTCGDGSSSGGGGNPTTRPMGGNTVCSN